MSVYYSNEQVVFNILDNILYYTENCWDSMTNLVNSYDLGYFFREPFQTYCITDNPEDTTTLNWVIIPDK
jgi:hypothetical protein